jgi:hypothetical protein
MLPQYDLSTLPYARYGAINFTLSSVSSEVFVVANTVIIPFYASSFFLAIIAVVDVALLCWGVRIRKGKGEV